MRILIVSLAAACAAAAMPAAAQTLKPGLWELQHKVGGNPDMDRATAEMQQQMAGESQVTITNPESYAMRGRITRVVDGKPDTMTLEAQGKWLSADCGSVKPIDAR